MLFHFFCNFNAVMKKNLLYFFRYLATGCSLTELHYSYRRGLSTIHNIVRATCQAIIKNLHHICTPPTQANEWIKIADGFKRNANFPNCIGAIDGKHIRIIRPCDSGSLYFNYKKYFSINLLKVCDSDYKFIYVDVGSYGKSSDSTIFYKSSLRTDIEQNNLNIPELIELTETTDPLPLTFVGDEAFPLSAYMQRPYAGNNLSHKQIVYNYRLSRARRYIECAFGIMANKWRIFHRPINVGVAFSEEIIKTCCILHNFVRSRNNTPNIVIEEDIPGVIGLFDNPLINGDIQSPSGNAVRNKVADYFVSDVRMS